VIFGNAARKVANWTKQQLPTRWPGVTVRKQDGEPDFIRGVVHTINRNGVWIETERHTIEPLMGSAYPMYCENCQVTIPGGVGFQATPVRMGPDGRMEEVEVQHPCMYCGPQFILRKLKVGEKVRMHFRFDPSGASAQWFAEKWEW
jgi:hypothetical protein